MTSPVLEVRELRHAYGERIALDGISFEVAEGEIFTLLGGNLSYLRFLSGGFGSFWLPHIGIVLPVTTPDCHQGEGE